MKNINELRATLREVDQSKYPELSNYTKADIWDDIGSGGLYLVANFKAKVIAADLWRDPTVTACDSMRKRHYCLSQKDILISAPNKRENWKFGRLNMGENTGLI
jgi:hypothetical protein